MWWWNWTATVRVRRRRAFVCRRTRWRSTWNAEAGTRRPIQPADIQPSVSIWRRPSCQSCRSTATPPSRWKYQRQTATEDRRTWRPLTAAPAPPSWRPRLSRLHQSFSLACTCTHSIALTNTGLIPYYSDSSTHVNFVSDLAKYSTTQSIARSLCDSWASCSFKFSVWFRVVD